MLAPKRLPFEFAQWNRDEGAPHGHKSKVPRRLLRHMPERFRARLRGPFIYQPNNATREYRIPLGVSRRGRQAGHARARNRRRAERPPVRAGACRLLGRQRRSRHGGGGPRLAVRRVQHCQAQSRVQHRRRTAQRRHRGRRTRTSQLRSGVFHQRAGAPARAHPPSRDADDLRRTQTRRLVRADRRPVRQSDAVHPAPGQRGTAPTSTSST